MDFSFLIGIIATLALGGVAAKHQLLSEGGILAAILVGLTIFTFGGWNWFLILAIFFVSASGFTRYRAKDKAEVNKEFAKGGVRDFWQVAANGALAALLAMINHYYFLNTLYFAFLGVVATVTADTLSTEIGVLSDKAYLITTLKKVEKGVSGAVSWLGLSAAFLGSLAIGVLAYILSDLGSAYFKTPPVDPILLIAIPTVAGLTGALIDSYLGATIQVMYWCPKCKKQTERETHKCGTRTVYHKGWKSINNDTVNLLSSICGAIIGGGLYQLFKGF
ncbi:MAG TPA: DUF92 domain-containing protein [Candidatus Norongarragalinales archaeon]|nr:DUF92 domain-containing protein [Candidatus Norongarragalinales archaeon]